MRFANVDNRLKLVVHDGAVDVERASGGRFGPDPQAAYQSFDEFRTWAASVTSADEAFDPARAKCPVPSPRQIFAIGLNYADHAAEAGLTAPAAPVVFTKFQTSLADPICTVTVPEGSVDWEVEVVAVIGRTAREVAASSAWDHVAGITVGQDLSERELQRSGPAPQFSLAKSFQGFSPIGPVVVTPDELEHPDDLELGCELNGVVVQKGQTREMIFSIPEVVSYLSHVVTLLPGDLIFTGTPSGVGMGRTPPLYLKPGDTLHSWVVGVGAITQSFVAATPTSKGA